MTPIIRSAKPADIVELARLRWQLYTEQEPHDEPLEAYVERFTAFAVEALPVRIGEPGWPRRTAVWLQRCGSRPCPVSRRPGAAILGRSAT